MGLNHERQKLMDKIEELEAFLFLTFQLVPANKLKIGIIKKDINNLSKSELKQKSEDLDKFIKDPKIKYGLKVKRAELVRIYRERIPKNPSKNYVYYSGKWEIKEYFQNPKEFFGELWDLLPSHALIGYLLDQDIDNRFIWYLPEAQTYMDMCVCINALILSPDREDSSFLDNRKIQNNIKGAVMHSYIFLEAYLNGIALDYSYDIKDVIANEQKEIIFEWDFKNRRRKYLPTRDKVFKYVKMITGQQCPFLENNCPEMKFIFNDIENFRDSIVHPNVVSFTGTEYDTNKMAEHLLLPVEFAFKSADTVINFIRKIDKLIFKDKENRLFWLFDRDEKGLFPDIAFS